MERKINFLGKPLTLVGRNLQLNKLASNFRVVSPDLKEVTLSDFKEKIKLITSFPSSDTPVCDLQLKEFNKRATSLSGDVVIIGISKDLPFAQKRFCEVNNIKNVTTLSDYKYSSFGVNYGLLIKELNLLARSILILDKTNVLRYVQLVGELTQSPNYEDAVSALGGILKTPNYKDAISALSGTLKNSKLDLSEELPGHCKPCEAGVGALTENEIVKLLSEHRGWECFEDRKIFKEFKFKDFVEAKYFLDLVSIIAEEQGHHPILTLNYNKLKITLTTHAVSGLSENDFIMAKIIDEL